MTLPATYLQMLSTITKEAQLRLELTEQPMPVPKPDQILVRVEATPINPSDHGVMFGWTDMSAASSSGKGAQRVLSCPVQPSGMHLSLIHISEPTRPY